MYRLLLANKSSYHINQSIILPDVPASSEKIIDVSSSLPSKASELNEVWMTDITYNHTYEGWFDLGGTGSLLMPSNWLVNEVKDVQRPCY